MIIDNLLKNVETAKKIVKRTLKGLPGKRTCACASALKDAIVTSADAMDAAAKKRLQLIIEKYVK
jgi:5'-methylthioadenosine phosphorylase